MTKANNPLENNTPLDFVEKTIETYRQKLEEELENEKKRLLKEKGEAFNRLNLMEKNSIEKVEQEWYEKELAIKMRVSEREKQLHSQLNEVMKTLKTSGRVARIVEEIVEEIVP
ncbi:hypothetical protein [Aminobacterium mobile]|uniref:hypothetical protein n=1 Tax=Aminobacterium mobile TaxID=81467 RepID=UPI000463AA7D|nr:hypothetical protein [Aminobacterium mobile]